MFSYIGKSHKFQKLDWKNEWKKRFLKKQKKKTSQISTKSHYLNPANISQKSNLVLINAALKKVI